MLQKKLLFSVATALSISLVNLNVYAETPVNTVNNGKIIPSGTFYNTSDGVTTFKNSSGGGLWLQSGSNLRGLEVNANGALTNNGGSFHLYAPGAAVRLDGDINVRGVQNGNGAYLGNGGKVFVDSAYLFQNGNIFANGINGGLVQFNVEAATLGNNAKIMANGYGGTGGVVSINASGPVDIGRQSLVSATGKVLETIDTNVINIEGSVVHVGGTLISDGVQTRGGIIRLVSSGQSNLSQSQTAIGNAVTDNIFTTQEACTINNRLNHLANTMEGDIHIAAAEGTSPQAILSASGTGTQINSTSFPSNPFGRAADGGTIILTAKRTIDNGGLVIANGAGGTSSVGEMNNGGNGGTISLNAGTNINNHGRLVADGGYGGLSIDLSQGLTGGTGGLIALSYKQAQNTGVIRAMGGSGGFSFNNGGFGGRGGLIVFSGNDNATGNGVVATFGGEAGEHGEGFSPGVTGGLGTIVMPMPLTASNRLYAIWQTTQTNELLSHAENLLLLTRNGGTGAAPVNLFDRMLAAQKRSVLDPTNWQGQAEAKIIEKNSPTSAYQYRNLVASSTRDGLALNLVHPYGSPDGGPDRLIFPSPLSTGQGLSAVNTLTLLNDGAVNTQFLNGGYADSPYEPTDFWIIGRNNNPMGGGRISLLATGNVNNLNIFGTAGNISGGSVHIATDGSVDNSAILGTNNGFHGGSLLLKAGNDIVNDQEIYFSVGQMKANGGLMGGTIRILPKNDFSFLSTYTNGSVEANGGRQGGTIEINAGHDSLVDFHYDIYGSPPKITANGTSPTFGRGGFIYLKAGNNNIHNGIIEANGKLGVGAIITEP